MNTTKVDSLAVVSIACLSSLSDSRLRASAMISAPRRAHRAALGRRRDAEEDRAEHQEDQRQRRNHHEDDALGEPRQQPELEDTVDDRGKERDAGADARRDDDHLVGGIVGAVLPVREGHRGNRGDDGQDEQRSRAAGAVRLAQRARFERQRRRPCGFTAQTPIVYAA